jgi:hypothetical protein
MPSYRFDADFEKIRRVDGLVFHSLSKPNSEIHCRFGLQGDKNASQNPGSRVLFRGDGDFVESSAFHGAIGRGKSVLHKRVPSFRSEAPADSV